MKAILILILTKFSCNTGNKGAYKMGKELTYSSHHKGNIPVYCRTNPLLLSEASLRKARKSVLELLLNALRDVRAVKAAQQGLRESGPS